MNFDEELISFVCQKYNIDITDFHATLLDFVNEKRNANSGDEPQKLEKDDDIETISQKAKAAVQPQQQNNDSELFNHIENDNDKNKTRDEKKQDRVFEPGQRVKINTNYGTSKEPHYLVGEFIEDVDNENVKVKLLSTGRPRTVDKKSIVLTESKLFNRILKEETSEDETEEDPIKDWNDYWDQYYNDDDEE